MKLKLWLKLVVVFLCMAVAIVAIMYVVGYMLLKMPLIYVSALATIAVIAAAIGFLGPLIAVLRNTKR